MKRATIRSSILRTASASVFAFAIALTPLGGVELASAAVGTQTWTGAAGDHKLSTPGNWQENETPETGDQLVFNIGAADGSEDLVNDLATDVRLAGITVDSTSLQNYSSFFISDIVRLQDGATLTTTGTLTRMYLIGGVDVAGDLIMKGNWGLYEGNVAGSVTADGTDAQQYGSIGGSGITGITSLTLKGNTSFSVWDNISFPITVEAGAKSKLGFYDDCKTVDPTTYDCTEYNSVSRTISGALTLAADLTVYVGKQVTVNVTGQKSGTGNIVRDPSSHAEGALIVNGQALVNPTKTTALDGSIVSPAQGAYVQVYDNETAVLNGTRESIDVYSGGILKGNGTVRYLYVGDLGLVAPGNSPGTITVQDSLYLAPNSTYGAEILNKDAYDKLIVGEAYTGSSNAVVLNNAKLDLKFLAGGKVNQGETFTIIDNRSTTTVSGTFAGLPEGSRIVIGKAVFAISYVGGTGNDVVLTALVTADAPATPNTGFRLITGNPALVAGIGIAAAGALLVARRRFNQ